MKYIIILILFLFAFKVKEPSYYIGQVLMSEKGKNWAVAEIIRAEDLESATSIFNKFLATDSVMKKYSVNSSIFVWKVDFDRSPITEKYLTPVKEVK